MSEIYKNLNVAITVCDENANIIEMNEKAQRTFSAQGGSALIGKSLYDCHKQTSNEKIKELLQSGKENAYTIEKNGVKKLIYQGPWKKEDGSIGGLVEFSLEIPFDMPHFVRKP